MKINSNPVCIKTERLDDKWDQNSSSLKTEQTKKLKSKTQKSEEVNTNYSIVKKSKRIEEKSKNVIIHNVTKMENEVDEDMNKILHVKFEGLQDSDTDSKRAYFPIASESRNTQSMTTNPNKYSETRMLEDMILKEVDLLDPKNNTCSTDFTSNKAIEVETDHSERTKKEYNPYAYERFGDLTLFKISSRLYINPAVLNIDNRLTAICKRDSKEKGIMNTKYGQKIRLVRHYKDSLFYALLQPNGYFGEKEEVKLIRLENFSIYNKCNPKGKRYYRILSWEDFNLNEEFQTTGKWEENLEIAIKAKDKLTSKLLVIANEDIRFDYRFDEVGVNQLLAKKGDILCVCQTPNKYNWIEAYKAEDSLCEIGVIHADFVTQLSFE